jgi:hypothetical protein
MGAAPDAGIYIMRSVRKIANRGFFLLANLGNLLPNRALGLVFFELEREDDVLVIREGASVR